jgi:excisionase family DNA binding protein
MDNTIDGRALFTVPEAASLLSCGQSTIRRMERDGRLRSVLIGADLRITAISILEILQQPENDQPATK